MKKIILLLLIVVSSGGLKAQEAGSSSKKFFLGPQIGYGLVKYESVLKEVNNFADLTFNNVSYGILLGFRVSSLISLQVEGNYAQYGARDIIPTYIYSAQSPLLTEYGESSTIKRVDMNISSIDIPLTVRFTLGENTFRPYIYGGVNYGINVSSQGIIVHEVTFNDAVSYRYSKDDITSRIKREEFAPVAGAGVMITAFKFSIFGDIRYKYGINNLSNVDNQLGFTNRALWVSAGILFNL
jgi:hypothetical protein